MNVRLVLKFVLIASGETLLVSIISLTQPVAVLEHSLLAITADPAQRDSKVTRQSKYRGGDCLQRRVMYATEFGCRVEPLAFPARC